MLHRDAWQCNSETRNMRTLLRSGLSTHRVLKPSEQMVAAGDACDAGTTRRLKQTTCDLLGILLLFACMAVATRAAPVLDSTSGHYYQVVVPDGGIDWNDARSAAASLTFLGATGHLATISSTEENQFILSLFDPSST